MRGEISLSMMCALVLAVVGCGLVYWGASSGPSVDSYETTQVATSSDSPARQYETRAIRDIPTGHRVMADNPELGGIHVEVSDIDPATWRNVTLQMTKEDGGQLDIVLLRPLDWINAYAAYVGGTIHLDLEEFGAVGPASVLAIDPCPPIEDGPGRIVTATFAHSSADVLDIHVEGLSEPIGTTANHPFWSEDRQAFVAAEALDVGERLLLADGNQALVVSVSPRQNAQPVFNLEVDGQHVYYVSEAGLLVHNTCTHGHHALPMFLGGKMKQVLSRLNTEVHKEFHRLLRANLRSAGIPLNVGGRGGSAADWARYMTANPGSHRKAFDAVLDTSRSIDMKHGTSIVQKVWRNIIDGNFTPFP